MRIRSRLTRERQPGVTALHGGGVHADDPARVAAVQRLVAGGVDFFATPASAARLIVAAKNIVAVWFLGGYLLLLAAIWELLLRTHLARVLSCRRDRPARPHAPAVHGDAAAVAAVCRGTEKGGTLSTALWRAVLRQHDCRDHPDVPSVRLRQRVDDGGGGPG